MEVCCFELCLGVCWSIPSTLVMILSFLVDFSKSSKMQWPAWSRLDLGLCINQPRKDTLLAEWSILCILHLVTSWERELRLEALMLISLIEKRYYAYKRHVFYMPFWWPWMKPTSIAPCFFSYSQKGYNQSKESETWESIASRGVMIELGICLAWEELRKIRYCVGIDLCVVPAQARWSVFEEPS